MTRKTRDTKQYFNISLVFTIVQRIFSKKGVLTSLSHRLNEGRHYSVNREIQIVGQSHTKSLTGEFIAGLVTSNGVFSAVLVRRTNNNKHRHRIDFKFILQLRRSESNKNLIFEIKNYFSKGNIILHNTDNTIKYQITTQKDLLNVVIPFFMKYHLRGDKLLSFLRFKYILEIISSTKSDLNKDIFLSLIVIAGQINSTDKLGNKIRYLNPEEQKYVINNIIPEGVDIDKLTNSIANFKQNPISLDFVDGLLLSNSHTEANLRNINLEDQNYIRENFFGSCASGKQKGVKFCKFQANANYTGLKPMSALKSFKDLDKRSFSFIAKSTLSTQAGYSGGVTPVKIYINADQDKLLIIDENKGKSGIYR